MSCVPITAAMRQLLGALTAWPDVDTKALRRRPEWDQARAWGSVMESGELTGTGSAHVRELPRGAGVRVNEPPVDRPLKVDLRGVLCSELSRHSVTKSPWRWATFHSPSSRRYTCVARKV
jgi:hypothetical protein